MFWESAAFKKAFDGNFFFFLLVVVLVILAWGYLAGHCQLCKLWKNQSGVIEQTPYVSPSDRTGVTGSY